MASKLKTEQEERSYRLRVHDAIHNLRSLPPNWNGYGAEVINPSIIESARSLVDHLPTDLVAPPKVVPMTNGRLQFEWHRGNRSLELEFESPTTVHFLKWDSDHSLEEEGIIWSANTEEITRLLTWFATE